MQIANNLFYSNEFFAHMSQLAELETNRETLQSMSKTNDFDTGQVTLYKSLSHRLLVNNDVIWGLLIVLGHLTWCSFIEWHSQGWGKNKLATTKGIDHLLNRRWCIRIAIVVYKWRCCFISFLCHLRSFCSCGYWKPVSRTLWSQRQALNER